MGPKKTTIVYHLSRPEATLSSGVPGWYTYCGFPTHKVHSIKPEPPFPPHVCGRCRAVYYRRQMSVFRDKSRGEIRTERKIEDA
jgi:hypothetical protein